MTVESESPGAGLSVRERVGTQRAVKTRELVVGTFAVLLGAGCSCGPVALQGKAVSGFDADADGWEITGDAQTQSVKADYNGTGGNPGGLISAKDDVAGGVWFFVAPSKYLGNNTDIAGKLLKYDLKVDATPSQPFDDVDVKLVGGGVTLVYDTPENPVGEQWTTYTVRLEAADWKVDSLTGAAATAADMEKVLGDTTALWIRGEFNTGPDTGFLDNVRWGADLPTR